MRSTIRTQVLAAPARLGHRLLDLDTSLGALLGFLLLALPLSLTGLGDTGAVTMEGMVGDSARHMLETGEILVPRLYGEIYTYKPPMAYWLPALSIGIFGDNEWALRLPSALAGVVMGLAALLLIGRLTRPFVGFLTGIASISGVLYIQKLRLAEYDAILAAAVGVAVFCAIYNLARAHERASTPVWIVCYLALAAAFLTKGIPALMAFGPGLLAAAIVTARARRLWQAGHLLGVGVFGLLVGGYLWLAWRSGGDAVFAQPVGEAGVRGFQWSWPAIRRTALKPLLVWAMFLPWSLVWFCGLKRRLRFGSVTDHRLLAGALAFLTLGTLAFVAVPTLQNRYFLPLAAPAALVAALALDRLETPSRPSLWSAAALAASFGAGALAVAVIGPLESIGARVVLACVAAAALGLTAKIVLGAPRHAVAGLLLITTICGWSVETIALRPHRASSRDLSAAAAQLRSAIPPRATVWVFGPPVVVGLDSSLYYYLDRRVRAFRSTESLPPGAHLILTEIDRAKLAAADRATLARLEPVHEVRHERGVFRLYRNPAPAGAAAAAAGS